MCLGVPGCANCVRTAVRSTGLDLASPQGPVMEVGRTASGDFYAATDESLCVRPPLPLVSPFWAACCCRDILP